MALFFINPPFSNYLNLPKTVSIKGSYTLDPRPGLLLQTIKTLRYSSDHDGWINKIGLRNKGIDWALENINNQHIVSVAIMSEDEIPKLIHKIPKNRNIELNISCPNAEKKMISSNLNHFLSNEREWCIIKLSPRTTDEHIDALYKEGFRQFHCCNTIPVKEGGLSGPSLKPYTIEKIAYIKNKYPDAQVISGGGIQNWNDIEDYKKIGADYFSASTVFFNPFKAIKLYWDYRNKE